MALSNSSQFPPGLYCGPCGCPPPPGIENFPPPPGIYREAEEQISLIVPPILLTIGTVGNCLTIFIILRQWRRITSTAVFLLALALSDLVILYTGLLRIWMKARWSMDVRSRDELSCKFSLYFTYVSIHLSSWILVAVTVERVISVIWPMKVKYGCRPRLSAIVLLVTIIALLALDSHYFYGYGRSTLPLYRGLATCEPLYQHYYEFINDIWFWIDFVVSFALPFVILTTGNAMIIYKLAKTRAKVRKLSIIESSGNKTFNKETRSTTIVLILLCVLFLVCMSPSSIYFVYLPYKMEKVEREMCNDLQEYFRQIEITKFSKTVTNMLVYVNASFNFVMYVLSGTKFRNELKSLLCCGKKTTNIVFGVPSGKDSTKQNITTASTETSISANQNSISTDQSSVCEKPEVRTENLSAKL